MSGDKLIMSDDWTEIEDRIFRQNLKVKFRKGWWNSSLQVLTSNYQPSKKILEQKIKNSSLKNSTRQSAFHEWWLICHEWWRPILQVTVSFMISVTTVPWSWKRAILNFFLAPRLVMSGDKFVISADTQAEHFFLGV